MPRINYRNKIIFSIVIVFIFLLLFGRNFHLTEWDYPIFIGDWDEAFTVNAAINVFYAGGFPLFYNYGGVSVYPQSLIFLIYEKITGQKPSYRGAGEFPPQIWPIYRRSYPVKAIYLGRKDLLAVFSITVISSFYLMLKLTSSYFISLLYAILLFTNQMNITFSQIIKPEIYVMSFTMLSYLCFLLCVKNKSYKHFLLQSVFCGLAIGSKMTSLSLIILLFFAAVIFSKTNGKFKISDYIKMLFLGLSVVGLMLVISNPAILFKFRDYYNFFKFVYSIHLPSPILWKGNFITFLSWVKSNVGWINCQVFIFIVTIAIILAFLKERFLLLATISFLISTVFQNLMTCALYVRTFIHLVPIIYFVLLFPLMKISEIILIAFDKIKIMFNKGRSLRWGCYLIDRLMFSAVLIIFCINNAQWFGNYRYPVHNLRDSRIILFNFIKSHQDKGFLVFNFHYYSMPDEFEELHNVKVFEEIADLDKIVKPYQNYYIVYFDEKGGYCPWMPGGFKEKHKDAMRYFRQFPKFKTIRGNYKNEFGGQGPARNPRVVIREFR